MKRFKHWQDPVNALLGTWLVVSPWVLGFQGLVVATTSTVAIGTLLIASSLGAMSVPQAWEEGLDALLGATLMLAPALLGFDAHGTALQNALITGAAVVFLALWVLATDEEYDGWWQRLADVARLP